MGGKAHGMDFKSRRVLGGSTVEQVYCCGVGRRGDVLLLQLTLVLVVGGLVLGSVRWRGGAHNRIGSMHFSTDA